MGNPVVGSRLSAAVLVVAASLAIASGTLAAAGAWTPTSVRGVVVYLLDGKWEEVSRGQELSQATLRTLRNGRLSLTGPNVTLDVGPNSALQLAMKPDGSAVTIDQYLGTINVAAHQSAAGLVVRAGKVVLSGITGEVTLLVADTGTSIVVESGTAAVTSPGGKKFVLDTGSYTADASGLVVEQGPANAAVAEPAAAGGRAAVETGATNSAASNGSANSAANGNGAGGSGNANSGNGGGNGNGSGNGNGNGNGNGGGNGGGNGNANGGGNGNGKGNT